MELLNEMQQKVKVDTSKLWSYYCSQTHGGGTAFYHLHPELVAFDSEAVKETTFLCSNCSAHVKSPSKGAPSDSIAAGKDFGLLSRLKLNGQSLEMPNPLEEMVLSDYRLYSMVAKVHVPDAVGMPARRILHGHMISFMHDAPQVLHQHFA